MESIKNMFLRSVSGKRKENDMKKRRFLDNGSIWLKELIADCNEHGVLDRQGRIIINGEKSILPWSVRLKIGKEIANALTYFHMAVAKIIIHRDVKPMHVFLGKNGTVISMHHPQNQN